MKVLRFFDQFPVNLLFRKVVIASGMKQERPIKGRRGQHNRIGTAAIAAQTDASHVTPSGKALFDQAANFVFAYQGGVADLQAKLGKGNASIGYRAAGTKLNLINLNHLAGC